MAQKIKRVAVLGAGVMGSGIAAHMAGVGLETLLLDIVPPELTEEDAAKGLNRDHKVFRNKFAASSLQKATKAKPPVFYNKQDVELIQVGNFDDDMARLADCDWIVEAVTESLPIKQKLFTAVDQHRKPGSLVTSNTSGLAIKSMVDGRSDDFARHFFVTHFFNPVRFMRLLELVKGEQTDQAAYDAFSTFGADVLGKGIVHGKDTPNFIANRIAMFGMSYALHVMERDGFNVQEIDAVFGPALARPKTAIFQLADLVGIDTLVHVINNCYDNLPEDDCRDYFKVPSFITQMVEKGWLGRKTKAGFYKKEGKELKVIDTKTLEYGPKEKVLADSIKTAKGIEDQGQRIKAFINSSDRLGKLAWEVTAQSLIYGANRMGEICDDVVNLDNAMKWGFNNDLGPFETWDAIGVPESVERMTAEGMKVPGWVVEMVDSGKTSFYGGTAVQPQYYDMGKKDHVDLPLDERHIRLPALKEAGKVIKKNAGATIYDAGDGILLLEFHTKMNAVDNDIITMMHETLDLAEGEGWNGVVVANEDKTCFSAGANLFAVLMAINQRMFDALETMIKELQRATLRMRQSDIPVVTAPAGLALGGGAEIVMGGDAVRAHAELYMGLVEIGVGVIPAGGGCLCDGRALHGRGCPTTRASIRCPTSRAPS